MFVSIILNVSFSFL